ncbi:histidinol-phosphate transaminase [Kistimonas scapharcae]|uniref:Histidinol-phosphate transaminase n=1 Tax=Kistimonas scapharcae TaxID=1036133 RepID=A0ABP8V7L6_9GAMM
MTQENSLRILAAPVDHNDHDNKAVQTMSVFKSHIAAMSAYSPPLEGRDPEQHLLLDFNERTLPVSPQVRQALLDYLNNDRLQMYPNYGELTERIADYNGISSNQVMITNGSDQGIDLIIRASCREGDEAIIPGPSFAMYYQCAKVENLKIAEPQYTREEEFPAQAVLDAITPATRLIVIANPNNPSGTAVSRETIIEIAKTAPEAAILVDECYFEYTQSTVSDLVNDYPNLLVTRTFSKTWGLPSIRLGYVISSPDNINALLNVRGPYDVNQFAVVAATAALAHPEYTEDYVREVMTVSKPLFEAFLVNKQIDFWPSAANYLWTFPDDPDAINRHLQANNILVRPKADQQGRLGLRITLGNKAQTERLIQVLDEVIPTP